MIQLPKIIMEVEIISREYIKPSSPTPDHLKTHRISCFDTLSSGFHFPLILFYQNTNSNTKKQLVLKKSLSQTLSRYQHFAGKIKDRFSIECDDEGSEYVEARVKCDLSEFLDRPHLPLLHKFLPYEYNPETNNFVGMRAACFQVTEFGCGGIVVASFISHMIADGSSSATFLKDWATNSTSHPTPTPTPIFDLCSPLPPHINAYPTLSSETPHLNMGNPVTTRFVLSASSIAKLKSLLTEGSITPTRVEAVSVLIVKRIMAAFRENSGAQNQVFLNQVVNMRYRAEPKYSDHCIGNFGWGATAKCRDGDDHKEVWRKLREAVKRIDGEFVRKFEGDGAFSYLYKVVEEMTSSGEYSHCHGDVDYVTFSSLCNFGMYQVDFGWGNPIWATMAGVVEDDKVKPIFNKIMLQDMSCGRGIEALITLTRHDMDVLAKDKEFLAFAKYNPSLLMDVDA